ncbi:LysR family transcriptional regulator ArgP [Arthrobacter sp. BPSS-3]|uniref:LysR family transcriptional regulator ArgP n=1 Tax=Arthrobacter sp. BPSS-3 TaxID=3366580 RepID=UPI0037DC4F17
MIDITPEQARTLAAIVAEGSFEAAADELSVTASAVSQRIRALETAVGRPVLTRGRPPALTDAGHVVVRYARRLELLTADLAEELQPAGPHTAPRLTLVINSDSLHTWALPGVVAAGAAARLEILREDQEHSLDLLRSGAAAAAVTATAEPVPGCTSRRLGTMRYLAACTPDFARRWFPDGVSADALDQAPMLAFDRKDDLQDRWLASMQSSGSRPPRHYIPAAQEFADAIRQGLGWGLMPDLELDGDLRSGRLGLLSPGTPVDVTLYWQQWRQGSAALTGVADAIRAAASVLH